ncbi:hypothetical protein [Desulfonatronovibrio hydrogenovorans]|uniref:hypothetical protein n=1 Tax=Desulfonatronovibrio hydrogenovorans TaxID=53245 RepID=UPI00048DB2CE|nr:hypothetical protein [Desulfonatronovibrio hydrogenovorans]
MIRTGSGIDHGIKSTISDLLLEGSNLLLVCPSKSRDSLLQNMIVQSQGHIGIISDDFPFLSSLSVIENVALSNMFHQNVSLERVKARFGDYLAKAGLEEYLWKSPRLLPHVKLVLAKLLRCVCSGNSIVFMGSPRIDDARVVLDWIRDNSVPVKLWISCVDEEAAMFDDLALKQVDFAG